MRIDRRNSAGPFGGDPRAVLLLAHVSVDGVGGDHRDECSDEHRAPLRVGVSGAGESGVPR
jgi:hypothetical protein